MATTVAPAFIAPRPDRRPRWSGAVELGLHRLLTEIQAGDHAVAGDGSDAEGDAILGKVALAT